MLAGQTGANVWAAVLEHMGRLTVDELEDDASGMWSDSSSTTLEEMN
jgi:hypothetical protein